MRRGFSGRRGAVVTAGAGPSDSAVIELGCDPSRHHMAVFALRICRDVGRRFAYSAAVVMA